MRTKIFLNCFSIFLLTTISQAQWYDVTKELPAGWGTNALDAADSLTATGPIYGFDYLYKTEDGGESWIELIRPTYLEIISIVDKNKIWFSNYSEAEIWATKDGGLNWELQFYEPTLTQFINYIEMFDSLNGMAMGDAPSPTDPALFLRTTDGGENWESMNDDELIGVWSFNVWRAVDFVDINVGYFYDWFDTPKKLYKTINSGRDWVELSDSLDCTMIKFYNEFIGLLQGGECNDSICEPNVYLTIDGGQSWEFIYIDSMETATDIEFIPGKPSDVWMIAGNKAFFSSDTGRTWTEELYIPILKPAHGFRDMVFTDKNHGWILGREPLSQGFKHHIYRTTNGGFGGLVSVENQKITTLPIAFYLSQNYPNPFNPTTNIKYSIPQNSIVELKIFDVLGNEIVTLVNEEKPAGTYDVEFNGSGLTSGIYFYQLKAGTFAETKKMVLLK